MRLFVIAKHLQPLHCGMNKYFEYKGQEKKKGKQINFTFSSLSQSDGEAVIYYEYQNPEHTHVHIRRGGYVEVYGKTMEPPTHV